MLNWILCGMIVVLCVLGLRVSGWIIGYKSSFGCLYEWDKVFGVLLLWFFAKPLV